MSSDPASAHFSGDRNAGLQVGQSSGAINYYSGSVNQFSGIPASTLVAQPERFQGSYYSSHAVAPVPSFVARPSHQELIESQLQPDPRSDRPRILIVSGLGGAGKSQIVLEFLEAHRKDYVATFWIDATTVASIEEDFTQIFRLLYPSREPPDVATTVALVKAKIQSSDRRHLVVFDGADEIEDRNDPSFIDLARFLPRLPGVDIIVTTRIAEASSLSALDPVVVKELENDEALELLQRSSKVRLDNENGDALAIIKELGNFALAISMAGAYIKEESEDFDSFRAVLESRQQSQEHIYSWTPHELNHQYGKNIVSTWETSFNAVRRKYPPAACLLSCLSFLNYNSISLDIFQSVHGKTDLAHSNSDLAETWEAILNSSAKYSREITDGPGKKQTKPVKGIADLKRCFNLLHIYSFVNQRKEKPRTFAMHKLVAEWGLYRLTGDDRKMLAQLILFAMEKSLSNFPSRRLCWEALLPHSMANFVVLQKVYPSPLKSSHRGILDILPRFASLAGEAGYYQYQLQLAEFVAQEAKHLSKYGSDGWLRGMADYASALGISGLPNQAESVIREVAEYSEKKFGRENKRYMSMMFQLGLVVYRQGRYEEATRHMVDVMPDFQRVYGKEHQNTLALGRNLALAMKESGRMDEAIEIDKRILEIERRKHGEQDERVLLTVNNLAFTYWEQGRYTEARSMSETAVHDCRRILGDTHPQTLTSIHTLAIILDQQGVSKRTESEAAATELHVRAAALFDEALAGQRELLGEEHYDTLLTRHDMAWNLHYRGRHDAAITLMGEVIAQRTAALGAEHPDTQASRDALTKIKRETNERTTTSTDPN